MSFERTLEYKGETLRISEWSERTGVPQKILVARLNCGWEPEKALLKPVRGWKAGNGSPIIPELGEKNSHREAFLDTEYGDQGAIL